MARHVILCSIGYIDVPNNGIEHACSWASCDSPFSINLHFSLSNVLMVLASNFMVHKSSYCKCSLVWCQARTFLLFAILRGVEWVHDLFLFPLVLGKMKLPHAKIGSFLCSLANLLQKNVIFFFFGNQISKWRSFEKRAIFDLLFTFFSYQGKITKIPSAHISVTYIHVFCSPYWLFLPYQFWKKYEFIRYGFSLVWVLVLVLIRAILEQSINNKMVSKI